MVTKQKLWKALVRIAIISGLLAIPVLIMFGPGLEIMGSTSSSDVEDILYERVDEYNRAVSEIPGLADIVIAANTNPEYLNDADRQSYLATYRRLLGGWEIAWYYHSADDLDDDAWRKWNHWYIEEFNHRAYFGWAENKKFFSKRFIQHVDRSTATEED